MPKFTDENGITWDIKTTTIQAGSSPSKGTWFAGIDDSSARDYSGNQFVLDDESTFDGQGGTTTRITWPASGNPILRGPATGTSIVDDALASVRAFAARQKAAKLVNVALRASSSPDNTPGSLVALLVVVALVYFADKR